MRVTHRSLATTSLQGLNRNLGAVQKLQEQLTSGKTISRPSDSPTGTNEAMRTRAEQVANDQYARNISDGQSWLNTTDSTLGTMLDQVRRVRDLTVQGLDSGGMSDASRQALATEVGQIRQGLIGLANTKVQGRPMFGGVTSSATAYATDGTYAGRGGTAAEAATPITRRTSDTSTVRVDITGPEAFGDASTGDDDLFAVVDKIATALTPDPANPTDPAAELTSQLSALDGAITRLTTARTDVGTRAARLDDAAQLQQDRGLTLASRLSAVEDIDMPKVIMDLQQQQVGYQAALAATAKAIPNSLVDYLR